MAYATPANMVVRYDVRRLGQLLGDTGAQLTSVQVLADTNLAALLDDASGIIDSHMLRGGRYTQAELAAFTGTNQAFLVRITCDLTYNLLVRRRGYSAQEAAAQSPGYAEAQAALEALADGQQIFALDRAIEAGKPTQAVLSADLYLLSSAYRHFGVQPFPTNVGSGRNLE